MDCIVVGAGVAGLAAAQLLRQAGLEVLVAEARDRIGGRIHTLRPQGWPFPVEAGAEFVHGRPEALLPLARGAHGWVPVGALPQQRALAKAAPPLHFAGEATHFAGACGTVHGAIESGQRAAREILKAGARQVAAVASRAWTSSIASRPGTRRKWSADAISPWACASRR